MTSARIGSWPVTISVHGRGGRPRLQLGARGSSTGVVALTIGLAFTGGCASLPKTPADAWRLVNTHVTHPVRYRAARADPALRRNLDYGEDELAAGHHRAALAAFNYALWDVEYIHRRSLRLAELASIHDALARAYAGIGDDHRAQEERGIRQALAGAKARQPVPGALQKLARAKDAYVGAQFRDARKRFLQALLDLEDVLDTRARMAYVADARCHLAYVYFATGERERVRDELRRLSARDPSLAACWRQAPPGVRAVIGELQRAHKDL